ncbi:MAG: hypothetical protein U1A78_35300 [Polyangia bacterium]
MTGHSAAERVAREDLVLFINACFAATGQSEFYGDAAGQGVSIRFLHEYIQGNYRRLYARTLAAGINHFSRALIALNLLRAGAPTEPAQREEEGRLILATLLSLPAHRAYHLFREVRSLRINNRRTRAVMAEFLRRRPDPVFDAVKYRAHVRAVATHAHLKLPGELPRFLFATMQRGQAYETPLLDAFRRAHYAKDAIYELPYSIAHGLAAKHGVPQGEFLTRIAPRMTAGERLRLLGTAERAEAAPLGVELARVPLTRLCLYVLSLPPEERRERREELGAALGAAARRALGRGRQRLGRVAAVLDRSYSSSGSREKLRRPLAVALAVAQLLRATADEFRAFWTVPIEEADEIFVTPRGQSDLATPLCQALAWRADLVVVVSDGYENDPPGAAAEIVRRFRAHLDPKRSVSFVHVNPVFDSERFAPRALGPSLPTIGLRDAEDLLTLLGFARFADGVAPLGELEAYLSARMPLLLAVLGGERAMTAVPDVPAAPLSEVPS